tara:strand:- start:8797 stop:9051 length:255 start_codon:yes stop_codon:yes gene_type:complete
MTNTEFQFLVYVARLSKQQRADVLCEIRHRGLARDAFDMLLECSFEGKAAEVWFMVVMRHAARETTALELESYYLPTRKRRLPE